MANLSSKTGTVTTPVQAQISLANNATTSVQDMSAYDSQEVTGFVYVDATADLRCSFSVQVVKNGAGTYEIAASDQSGDNYSGAPLLSFSMSGSVLRVTLPNVTGFVSAYLRYQLSAPYLGGNYPLSVTASQVLGGTSAPAAGYIGEQQRVAINTNTNFPATTVWGDAATLQLTAGVWDISALLFVDNGNYTATAFNIGISSTAGNNTTGLTAGDNNVGTPSSASTGCFLCIPSYRVIVTGAGTTNYYLKVNASYTANQPQYRARISAVRIA